MKTKLKYSLILVTTLIIGMIIGFLISGRMISTRVDQMRNYYTDNGFNREFIRIIQPSPEQRDEIMPILRKYAGINREHMLDFHEGQRELFFELKDELDTHLTDEQIQKLNHVWERRKEHFQNTKSPRKGRRRPAPN